VNHMRIIFIVSFLFVSTEAVAGEITPWEPWEPDSMTLTTPELRSKFNRLLDNGGSVKETKKERIACRSPSAFAQYMSFILYGNTSRPSGCFELKPNTKVKIAKAKTFETWDEAMGSNCLFGRDSYSPIDDGRVCCSAGLDVCAFQYDGLRSYFGSDVFYTTLHIVNPY